MNKFKLNEKVLVKGIIKDVNKVDNTYSVEIIGVEKLQRVFENSTYKNKPHNINVLDLMEKEKTYWVTIKNQIENEKYENAQDCLEEIEPLCEEYRDTCKGCPIEKYLGLTCCTETQKSDIEGFIDFIEDYDLVSDKSKKEIKPLILNLINEMVNMIDKTNNFLQED